MFSLLAMSVLINAWPIGIGLGLLVVGPLGELAGWRWGIASSAAFAAMGLAIVWAFYRPPTFASAPASIRSLLTSPPGRGALDPLRGSG